MRKGSIDIGRNSENDDGLLDFGRGITNASFHVEGKVQDDKEKLKMRVRMYCTSGRMKKIMLDDIVDKMERMCF